MKKNILGLVIAAALVAIAAFFLFGEQKDMEQVSVEVIGEPAVTIVRTADGYLPEDVTIQKGDIVLFTNESDSFHWPASDLHPTHGIYPEFDPQTPIGSGEEWKFKFDKVGVWNFHDHIQANKTGTITVVE